jgi:hypothetical protein
MTIRPIVGARRDRGARYLLITIVAFAITVIATRVYLDLSGYPKIGGGGLHVAHMLWGGLLLVVAALLIQLFVGRRALILSALAAGAGVGLFIDEVGKFITETNDYFFAPAAPIIYGAVLLLLLVWLVVSRTDRPTRNDAVQGAIEALRDLQDGRLTHRDRDRALARLDAARAGAPATDIERGLMAALAGPGAEDALAHPGWIERGDGDRLLRRILPDRLARFLVRVGLALSVLGALLGLLVAIVIAGGEIPAIPDPTGPIEAPTEPIWVLLVALVWVVVGAANGVALVLSVTGRHPTGMVVAQFAVLLGLIAGGLLNVYVSQVGALTGVIVQVLLLLLILDQRRRIRDQAVVADTA